MNKVKLWFYFYSLSFHCVNVSLSLRFLLYITTATSPCLNLK